ncbi:hypothetical protein IQ226_16415 [Dolichospermum sp. LEGE 00240]|jgi:hypothetical protein|uniref:hypothetical protein n=1 Tax=Dolichospermum sp. LEGE 00240 TaxID=1828603 RepID=UPI0018809ADD|nr:hypothetical protein [Dolichospermum sp. LEGE 00240]MBE9250692.1 hypothetical protein [Dolichospermum sp. LEGE 00240]MDM3844753.1 hypothetical protein [Aphanizomenon gracile PMC638.10]MDM3850269.1 hypothetical protein [Aphanizomenon gracile PMC627.10]MDM3856416.1 hypothetical protein [Aphanizomenon gracile PMC649.10]
MLNNQAITELTLQDLESLINRIVDEKINQINLDQDHKIEQTEIVQNIHILSEDIEKSNPFVQFDGIFKDDPLFDEFLEEMAKNRRELDAEIAAYESSLEDNKTA